MTTLEEDNVLRTNLEIIIFSCQVKSLGFVGSPGNWELADVAMKKGVHVLPWMSQDENLCAIPYWVPDEPILRVGFPLQRLYAYSFYRFSYLRFRYLKCLVNKGSIYSNLQSQQIKQLIIGQVNQKVSESW